MSLIKKHVLSLSIVLVSIILAVSVLEAGLRILESDDKIPVIVMQWVRPLR